MKKIISIIYLTVLALGFTSCDDFLNVTPEDSLITDNYYISEDAIDANTASLYGGQTWADFHMNFMWMAGDELAGDLYYTYAEEGHFYYMTFQNGNQFLTQGWNGLYRVISYCNNIINDMPGAASANGISEARISRGVAEARCIRGIAYYLLAEYWENVPIVTNNGMPGDQVVCNTQSSVYEFIRRDLVFASEYLPAEPYEAGRVSRYTAIGMLAKLHLTMASHLEDADSDANFALAKSYALQVIDESSYSLYEDLSTMFYPSANNNSESLFAIQCSSDGYGYGNSRNVAHSRNSKITKGSSYGGGKGPTLSLQEAFEANDVRRKLTFMRNGDDYNNLAGGGYHYNNYSLEDEGATDASNEMLAHIRKYVVGANEDCDGLAGLSNTDAGNNLYILRLADVYLLYVEASMGAQESTTDSRAIELFNAIRKRAGLNDIQGTITYEQLIKERRTEFAFESINFFDIKRMAYRDADKAVEYLSDMGRERQYYANGNFSLEVRNTGENGDLVGTYHTANYVSIEPDGDTGVEGSLYYLNPNVGQINITADKLVLPVPAETLTKTPSITAAPVEYSFNE